MTQPKLGDTDAYNQTCGKCPICGYKKWFYHYRDEIADCGGFTNQQRYKHQKTGRYNFKWDEIIWKDSCNKSKEIV